MLQEKIQETPRTPLQPTVLKEVNENIMEVIVIKTQKQAMRNF